MTDAEYEEWRDRAIAAQSLDEREVQRWSDAFDRLAQEWHQARALRVGAEDLLAAFDKRLAQLSAECDMTRPDDLAATCAAQRWSELHHAATALRKLLGGE